MVQKSPSTFVFFLNNKKHRDTFPECRSVFFSYVDFCMSYAVPLQSCLIKILMISDQVVMIVITPFFKEVWYKLSDINMVEALVVTPNPG